MAALGIELVDSSRRASAALASTACFNTARVSSRSASGGVGNSWYWTSPRHPTVMERPGYT